MSTITSRYPPSPDWVFHNKSNVHLATDKSWFVTYVPFDSKVKTGLAAGLAGIGCQVLPVHGVGTVEIPVKIRDKVHRKLRLDNVVHVPDYECNIICLPKAVIDSSAGPGQVCGRIVDCQGCALAVLKMINGKPCLAVSGPPVGPVIASPRQYGRRNLGIGATWDESERQRFHAYMTGDMPTAQMASGTGLSQRYTAEEKAWLKKHFGGEFRFLRQYNLSIYDEEERDEGRGIVRALMRGEQDAMADEDNADENEDDQFLRELEEDPMSHVADRFFSNAELRMIEKGYGHSGNFLRSYGLRPFDDGDCEEGKAIAAGLVHGQAGLVHEFAGY